MIIKQKSLIVVLISSLVISLVLVLTLIGYLIYIELKGEEFKRFYQDLLQKANAKVYSKYIEISKLTARTEKAGALKGKPIIEGVVKNNGFRNIANLLIRVRFLDRDGATIYEVSFHPQEPSLGTSTLPQVSIPYLSGPARIMLKPSEALPFKRILVSCPHEIAMALRGESDFAKGLGRWAGRLIAEVLSIEF
jgi:hypothetical protein